MDKIIVETPTFLGDILVKIVQFLRKYFTPEQRRLIYISFEERCRLTIQSRKNFQEFVDLLNTVPLYALTYF